MPLSTALVSQAFVAVGPEGLEVVLEDAGGHQGPVGGEQFVEADAILVPGDVLAVAEQEPAGGLDHLAGLLCVTLPIGLVAIQRRGGTFVLLRGEDYERQLAERAEAAYPRLSLDELLAGSDRTEHRVDWPDAAPRGRETL